MKRKKNRDTTIIAKKFEKEEFHKMLNTPEGREYIAQIQRMAAEAKAWLAVNLEANPIITFNVPKRAFLVTDIETALTNGYLIVDKSGQRMLDELGWTADTPTQPSFKMIQIAIQLATE